MMGDNTTYAVSSKYLEYANPQTSSRWYPARGKRLFDVTFSVVTLLVLAPLLALISLVVLITIGWPIFYGSPRLAQGGTFLCLKFRTMVRDADAALSSLLANDSIAAKQYAEQRKLDNDPRITRIGRFLRRTSLDELPQFINVLRGEMGVVGPRPKLLDERYLYGPAMDEVLTVAPGITGPWQVSGRNDLDYADRIKLDLFYVRHGVTFLGDLRLVARTMLVCATPWRSGAR